MIFCRQNSVSDGYDEVIEEEKRRKKVRISRENLRDGGEWDFKSGGSYWNSSPGLELQRSLPNKTGCCSYLWISKLMIIIFTVTNLLLIACGGVVFTLGLTGYWAHQEMFSYIMVRAHSSELRWF